MEKMANFIECIERAFNVIEDNSQMASILETMSVGPTRDKSLKNTQSWATNCLIRIYHAHSSIKEAVKQPEFIQKVKIDVGTNWTQNNGGDGIEWRIEDSGYLSCIDLSKKENNVEMNGSLTEKMTKK